ncbi:MAG: hypothetical protein ACFE9D_06405 [Promethearchaeota archaeon]
MIETQAAGEPTPELATGGSSQRFWWALLITLIFVFLVWGILVGFPFILLFWGIGLSFLIVFVVLVYRGTRSPAKLEFAEVRRLIACDQCGVETEGPLESGNHIFQEIGPCPRCEGTLYIKAIYSIDKKEPLKRQQPREETEKPKTQLEV